MPETLIRIVAPHFVAGVVVGERAAPIVRYMVKWSQSQILAYCGKKGWEAQAVTELDFTWLIEACGDDRVRLGELSLLFAGASYAHAVGALPGSADPHLIAVRAKAYTEAVTKLCALAGIPMLPRDAKPI